MSDFYVFLVSMLLTFVLMPFNIYASKKFGFVDVPKDNRRMHTNAVPTIGGISIFVSIMAITLIFVPLNKRLASILIGATIIAGTGFIDDIKNLKPLHKMLGQILAAAIAVYGGVSINVISNPIHAGKLIDMGIIGPIITMIWIVGVTNALNFVDGLDGLCGGLAAISALTFYFASEEISYIALVSLILAGSVIGFLPYNFNPAKIFMGDTGALLLGYMLACISVEGVVKSVATMSLIMPIFILALPVFDTLFAMIRRIINKQKIMSADKGHLHHRLVQKGYSVKQTVIILYVISILFSLLGLFVSKVEPSIAIVISALALIIVIMVGVLFGFFKSSNQDNKRS